MINLIPLLTEQATPNRFVRSVAPTHRVLSRPTDRGLYFYPKNHNHVSRPPKMVFPLSRETSTFTPNAAFFCLHSHLHFNFLFSLVYLSFSVVFTPLFFCYREVGGVGHAILSASPPPLIASQDIQSSANSLVTCCAT
jgi:hypothetical protein